VATVFFLALDVAQALVAVAVAVAEMAQTSCTPPCWPLSIANAMQLQSMQLCEM
jgi:hypothetical protein